MNSHSTLFPAAHTSVGKIINQLMRAVVFALPICTFKLAQRLSSCLPFFFFHFMSRFLKILTRPAHPRRSVYCSWIKESRTTTAFLWGRHLKLNPALFSSWKNTVFLQNSPTLEKKVSTETSWKKTHAAEAVQNGATVWEIRLNSAFSRSNVHICWSYVLYFIHLWALDPRVAAKPFIFICFELSEHVLADVLHTCNIIESKG